MTIKFYLKEYKKVVSIFKEISGSLLKTGEGNVSLKKSKLTRLLIILSIILVDVLLLRYFNTLMWPYFWPRPAIYIFVTLFVVINWFPEFFSNLWLIRTLGIAMVFVGQCYLLHSFQILVSDFSIISLIHFIGISGTFIVMMLSYVNQFRRKDNRQAPPLPEKLPDVVAVIPTYGEPIDILERTLVSLKQLKYPSDVLTLIVSDDAGREEVRELTLRYGAIYNFGPRRDAKAGNLNSVLQYVEENVPSAEFIITQDADETISPEFLNRVLGYFENPKVSFVQTPKEAKAPPGDPFGVRDRVFYDGVQPGRNGTGAAFSCGSGVVWRLSALRSIGGFATWNIVEDLTTSYMLHSKGYSSEYHNEILSVGLAPDDIPGLLKQRGTWAVDTWRLFLFKNPLFNSGLALSQRLQYLELGLFYTTSSFFIPMLMLTPLLSLLTGQFIPIEGAALFPWVFFSLLYYVILAGGYSEFFVRMWQYWVSHFPTYHKAFWIALRSRNNKPSYKVTRKTRQDGFYGFQLWPQFLYLFLGAIAIIRGLFFIPEIAWDARLSNIAILFFFMFMVSGICRAAFYREPTAMMVEPV